jgi:hypothetical protein
MSDEVKSHKLLPDSGPSSAQEYLSPISGVLLALPLELVQEFRKFNFIFYFPDA